MQTLNQTQTLFVLSMWAELGSSMKGSVIDIETKLEAEIKADLQTARPEIGEWELVWGPAVFQAFPSIFADNTIYVVKKASDAAIPQYVIAIAGTNPSSIFDGLVENTLLNPLRRWPYSSPVGLSPMVANGTSIGLSILQGLKPGPKITGAGTSISEFITLRDSGRAHIDVTGHSLGGALASVFALWLFDTQPEWDPKGQAQVSCLPFAGPTAGNQDFAKYFMSSSLGSRSTRVFNALDVVPHAWSHRDLRQIPSLYDPDIPGERDPAVQGLVAVASAISWFDNFCQIYPDIASLPGGKVNKAIVEPGKTIFENFISQIGFQHVSAYFELLNIPDVVAAGLRQKIDAAQMSVPAGGIQAFQDRLQRRVEMEQLNLQK
jgi:Lipase (class 3)